DATREQHRLLVAGDVDPACRDPATHEQRDNERDRGDPRGDHVGAVPQLAGPPVPDVAEHLQRIPVLADAYAAGTDVHDVVAVVRCGHRIDDGTPSYAAHKQRRR